MSNDPTTCPRCGAKLEWIEGWRDYSYGLVKIFVEGCMKCGYLVDEDDGEDEYLPSDEESEAAYLSHLNQIGGI